MQILYVTKELKQKPRNWTINGKHDTKTNFIVSVTVATEYVAKDGNIY